MLQKCLIVCETVFIQLAVLLQCGMSLAWDLTLKQVWND